MNDKRLTMSEFPNVSKVKMPPVKKPKGTEEEPKVVQLCDSKGTLFALRDDGSVYLLTVNEISKDFEWKKIPNIE
jgi:hypothetical protein